MRDFNINKIKIFIGLFIMYLFLFSANFASAGIIKEDTFNSDQDAIFGDKAGYVPVTPYALSQIVGLVIQAFLSLLGVIFVIYIIYAGYHWMTAQGDEEKVTKAKDTIQRAIIGLIIIIAAYAISTWVIYNLNSPST